jgi:hypothetical protein
MLRITCLASAVLAALSLSVAGCGKEPVAKKDDHKAADSHDHPSEGPHHGMLIELGSEDYHAELVHDDAAHKVTIYLLDDKAKGAVPVAEKDVKVNVVLAGAASQYVLPAAPLDGESDGKSSRFELVDEKLCDALDAKDVDARLKVTIGGRPYDGKIGAHSHEGDHAHEKK